VEFVLGRNRIVYDCKNKCRSYLPYNGKQT
jgi:ribosomal protein L24E